MRLFTRVAIALASLTTVAACTSGGSGNQPSPTPTPAASELQRLASLGMQQSYTAIYILRAKNAGVAEVQVGRTPTAYRLNARRGTAVSVLIHNPAGSYSCQQYPRRRATCFLIARGNHPIPELFDAGQELWTTYLNELSTNASAYLVTEAGTTPATATLPVGKCFALAPVASPAPAGSVPHGTVCLTEVGIPTSAAFPTGNLTLTRIDPAPRPNALLPLARPTPIPGLK